MVWKLKGWTIVFSACLMMLAHSLSSQISWPQLRNFSIKNGIVDLPIHAITRDQNDLIWLGTPVGLYTYDGKIAIAFDGHEVLTHTNITCLYKDQQDRIWVGTFNQGLFVIDSKSNKVKQFKFDPTNPRSISSNRIHDLTSLDSGKLLVALEKEGLDAFDPETNSFYNIQLWREKTTINPNRNNTILSICPDPFQEDIFWLGTLDGLIRYDRSQDSVNHYSCNKNNSKGPSVLNNRENTMKAIYCEKNKIYIGTWGGGLSVLDKSTLTWKNYKFEAPFPASGMRNDVIQIAKKNEDELWILAFQQELGTFNKSSGEFSFHGYKNIRKLYIDDQGVIWFGSLYNGLYAYFPEMERCKKYSYPFDLTAMLPSSENNLAYAGVFGKSELLELNLKDQSYQSIPFIPFFDKGINFISDLQYSKDSTLYLLGISGVYSFDQDSKKIVPVFSPFTLANTKDKITSSTSFLVDSRNNLWYATKFNGLFRYNLTEGNTHHYSPKKDKGHTAWTSDLMEDSQGNIWYGSGSGFGYYNPDTDKFTGFSNSLNNSSPDSLPFSAITSLTEDSQGNIWIGSLNKGLGKISDINSASVQTFTTGSAPMINDVILEVKADEYDNIWMRTREGLSMYSQKEKEFEHFGKRDGIGNLRAIIPWKDSDMIITANGGYYHIPIDLEKNRKVLPEILIRKITVFDKNYPTKKGLNNLDTLLLDYKDNFFSIDFRSIDLSYPHLTKHRYKMEGLHDAWIDIGTRQNISFAKLRGGKYKLHIQAGYGNKLWGKEKIMHVLITPPFWQETRFWILSILLLIILISVLFKRQINVVRKKASLKADFEKKLSEARLAALQSQMNPHFLFNCLNSIKLLTLENESEKASDYLTRFSRLVRLILKNSKQILVPLSDEIEMLRLYIEMESLRFDHEFSYEINIDPTVDIQQSSFPPMIIQIFVENAIKHGLRPKDSDKKLEIGFTNNGDYLLCTIKDNGIGREAAGDLTSPGLRPTKSAIKKESMGISNTLERLKHLKQVHGIDVSIEIEDLFEKKEASGTLVIIRMNRRTIDHK